MGTLNPYQKKLLDAGMPDKAWQLLIKYYVFTDELHEIKVQPNPYVEGTFAVRLTIKSTFKYRKDNKEHTIEYVEDIDLLWTKGDWEECEYNSWPPTANPNNLQFF